MDILDVVAQVDLELLKEQYRTVESLLDTLNEEKRNFADPKNVERIEIDMSNLEGLLEFLDNIIIALEAV